MSWIAEFTLAPEDFALGSVFDGWPRSTLELDRVVPINDTVMPYFWVTLNGEPPDFREIEAVIADCPELRSAIVMDELPGKALFRAEWEPAHMGVMRAIIETDLTVISGTGSANGWRFELRAAESDQFSRFQQSCAADSVHVSLDRLTRLVGGQPDKQYGLTPNQREALIAAYRGNYYSDSRGTNMESLAAQLGISRQAFSDRLRRGYRNLLEQTIIDTE